MYEANKQTNKLPRTVTNGSPSCEDDLWEKTCGLLLKPQQSTLLPVDPSSLSATLASEAIKLTQRPYTDLPSASTQMIKNT